jgi:hypothetical protein
MYNEFDKEEFMLDIEEDEAPKKKIGEWLNDDEIDSPELEAEDDDDEEAVEDEEEIPM